MAHAGNRCRFTISCYQAFTIFTRFLQRPVSVLDRLGISLEQCTSGIFLVGMTGSGKTSVIRIIEHELLSCGIGCVHACIKPDEGDFAEEVMLASMPEDYIIRFRPGSYTFNFVTYELLREGGSPMSLAKLLQRLNDMLMRSKGEASDEPYWDNLFYRTLEFAITAAWQTHRIWQSKSSIMVIVS